MKSQYETYEACLLIVHGWILIERMLLRMLYNFEGEIVFSSYFFDGTMLKKEITSIPILNMFIYKNIYMSC